MSEQSVPGTPVDTTVTTSAPAPAAPAESAPAEAATVASDVEKAATAVDPSFVAHVKAEVDKLREEVWAELAKLRARVGG